LIIDAVFFSLQWIKQVHSFLLALVAKLEVVRAALNNVGVLEKNPYLRLVFEKVLTIELSFC
jgi:hypothetical protein